MRVCLHLPGRTRITVEQALREYGPNPPAGAFACPVCNGIMTIWAQAAPARTAHFAHARGADCPTIDAAAAPFENLRALDPDPVACIQRQARFHANWRRHFLHLGSLVPALAIEEFVARLDLSLEWNIWSYVGLTDAEIPIVLALLDQFSPDDAMQTHTLRPRDHWYRFWVSHGAGAGADWPWPDQAATISRGRFRYRGGGVAPAGADFIDLEIVPVSGAFLEGPEPPTLHDYRENAVNAWFARHPAFGH